MSLLLDALKKAAEAKSKGDSEPSLDDTQPVSPPAPPIPPPPIHNIVDPTPAASRFDTSFDPEETFDQTHSDTIGHRFSPYDEFDETQQLEGDFGETTSSSYGSQRHAETVFASKNVQKPLRAGVPVLRLLISMLLVVGCAASIYWYLLEREVALRGELSSVQTRAPIVPLPDTPVAEEPETAQTSEVATDDGSTDDGSGEAVLQEDLSPAVSAAEDIGETEPVTADTADSGDASISEPVPASTESSESSEVATATPTTEVDPTPEPTPQPVESQDVDAQQNTDTAAATAGADAADSDAAEIATGQAVDESPADSERSAETVAQSAETNVNITQSAAPNKPDQLVGEGYRAYQTGDIERARDLYDQALAANPDHRDAMLGRAAIYLKQGQARPAIDIYRRLLARNPRDHDALAGLNSLARDDNIARYESDLRFLLTENPQSAPLNYALGVLLSRQQRWSGAQQHFFNAFTAEPDNPDIAFNLAVSLDNLGKSEVAAEYYRNALALAQTRAASFDSNTVRKRLETLEP